MNDLVLIGMPASGKSVAGRRAAELLGYSFTDGDDLIRARGGRPLSSLLEELGAEGFLRLEEETLCALTVSRCVVATGGSAVYSARAMEHLKSLGRIFYLKADEAELKRRLPDLAARGVVARGNVCTVEALYAERAPLYARYADVTVDCAGKSEEETARELVRLWREA